MIAPDKIIFAETHFLDRFPGGVEDTQWQALLKKHDKPRLYEAYDTFLSQENLKLVIEGGLYYDIIEKILKWVKQSTTVSVFEKIAFQNYLEHDEIHPQFLLCLYDFLYHFDEESFQTFVEVLSVFKTEKNAFPAKWPLITFIKAYQLPFEFSFVKPSTTKKVAKLLEWDIAYSSVPNFDTYMRIVEMVKQFKSQSVVCRDLNLMRVQGILFGVVQ